MPSKCRFALLVLVTLQACSTDEPLDAPPPAPIAKADVTDVPATPAPFTGASAPASAPAVPTVDPWAGEWRSAIPGPSWASISLTGPAFTTLGADSIQIPVSSHNSIALDSSGNLIVAGTTADITILTKADSHGANLIWQANTQGLILGGDGPFDNALAVDAQDNVFLAGYIKDPVFGVNKAALIKYPSGGPLWVSYLPPSPIGLGSRRLNSLAVCSSGDVFALGVSSGALAPQTADDANLSFFAHYSNDGQVFSSDNESFLGTFATSLRVGAGCNLVAVTNGSVMKLDSNLNPTWMTPPMAGVHTENVAVQPDGQALYTYEVELGTITKRDGSNGHGVWQRAFGHLASSLNTKPGQMWSGAFEDVAPRMVAANDGLYLTAHYVSTFTTGQIVDSIETSLVVLKLDTEGQQVWIRLFQAPTSAGASGLREHTNLVQGASGELAVMTTDGHIVLLNGTDGTDF